MRTTPIKKFVPEPNPSGLCMCGCGKRTHLAASTRPNLGLVGGKPVRYCPGHAKRISPIDYLVDEESGCWIWQRCIDKLGYGMTGRGRAHRWMWEQAHGPIPDGLELDHLCRNRACVNPDHLEPVTHRENCARGVNAKITQDIAERIREDAASGIVTNKLMEKYGLKRSQTLRIVRGICWPPGVL